MNWANLLVMNGQQAPAPSRVQAEPSAPTNVAVTIPQEMMVETTQYTMRRPITVRRVLPQLENRLVRSHATGPTTDLGGRSTGAAVALSATIAPSYRSTSAMRRLNQF